VWDLATGDPVGDSFSGHGSPVLVVATAELDGRPVVISGSRDGTVQVWDLASRDPIGQPLTGSHGSVNALTSQPSRRPLRRGSPAYVGVGTKNIATVFAICYESDGNLRWEQMVSLEVRSNILALALTSNRTITVATELGIVVFDLPGELTNSTVTL
jgi:WD40 repeat protein